MLFRINVGIKDRETHWWGEILCFSYNVHDEENVQPRPLGAHCSVGRRIRCNTGTLSTGDHTQKKKINK